jgi:hypothetical protein
MGHLTPNDYESVLIPIVEASLPRMRSYDFTTRSVLTSRASMLVHYGQT